MKISKLIELLKEKKKEFGDIDVLIEGNYSDCHHNYFSYHIEICKKERVTAYLNSDGEEKKIFDTALVLF